MPVTNGDRFKLVEKIRSSILSRRFALDRYWRANLFANESFLTPNWICLCCGKKESVGREQSDIDLS